MWKVVVGARTDRAASGKLDYRVHAAHPRSGGMAAVGASFPSPLASGGGRLTLMSEVKGRGSDLAFRLTAGRYLVIVIGCTGSEMERGDDGRSSSYSRVSAFRVS